MLATGTTATLALELECFGYDSLGVQSLQISGADAAAYGLVSPSGPFRLAPGAGQGQTVTIRFTPPEGGASNAATLVINNDNGPLNIPLRGAGGLNQAREWRDYH